MQSPLATRSNSIPDAKPLDRLRTLLPPIPLGRSVGVTSRSVRHGPAGRSKIFRKPRHDASPAEPQIMATWLKSVLPTGGQHDRLLVTAGGQSRWPPAGRPLAACGQFLMAADKRPKKANSAESAHLSQGCAKTSTDLQPARSSKIIREFRWAACYKFLAQVLSG